MKITPHLSDSGNAERFARHHNGRLLYCDGTGWLFYDGSRWKQAGSETTRLAKATVSQIYGEAQRCKAPEQRKALAGWALQSESEHRIRAMISLAQCELPVSADKLDQTPCYLIVRMALLISEPATFGNMIPKIL